MAKYYVQFAIIREVEVDSADDLQAERDAFKKLKSQERECAVSLKVFKEGDDECEGALASDTSDAWKYARENFDTLDLTWVDLE